MGQQHDRVQTESQALQLQKGKGKGRRGKGEEEGELEVNPLSVKLYPELLMNLSATIQGVDPKEPPGIYIKTFTNSSYPGPIFFHKKATTTLTQEHN